MPELPTPGPGPVTRRSRVLPTALGGAILTAPLLLSAAAPASPVASMNRAFEALQGLAPLAYGPSEDAWKKQGRMVRESVADLSAASTELVAHGARKDATFQILSQSLAARVRLLKWNVAREDYENASYFTQSLVETCIDCHVRLPAGKADFGPALLRRVDRGSLTPLTRAALETAGRQFDAALDTYEAAFGAVDLSIEADALGSYLILALRVKRDPDRARRGLAILSARRDLPAQLERNLETWRSALTALAHELRGPATLERAQAVLDDGRALSEFPRDAADDVHAVVASSLVFRYLEEKQPKGEELARALYLLARTQASSMRESEILESTLCLEEAIRAAPHTDLANRAYAQLELQLHSQLDSGQVADEADDLDAWLDELRELSRVTSPATSNPIPSPGVTPR